MRDLPQRTRRYETLSCASCLIEKKLRSLHASSDRRVLAMARHRRRVEAWIGMRLRFNGPLVSYMLLLQVALGWPWLRWCVESSISIAEVIEFSCVGASFSGKRDSGSECTRTLGILASQVIQNFRAMTSLALFSSSGSGVTPIRSQKKSLTRARARSRAGGSGQHCRDLVRSTSNFSVAAALYRSGVINGSKTSAGRACAMMQQCSIG